MKLTFRLVIITVTLFMAACSSDDDPTPNPVENITGKYDGYTVADFQYTPVPITTPGQSISLIVNEDGTCNISFESDTWGKFTIFNAAVTVDNDNYTIKGSGKTMMAMGSASPKEYDCAVEGKISKDKKTVSFLFDAPTVMGGLKITFTLGEASANSVVAAVYNGYTVADFKYTSIPITTPGQSITVTANEDGTNNISFESDTWGKFTISNATVLLEGNNYTIKGNGKTIMAMGTASPKEYDCTAEGIIGKDKETASFLLDVPTVMGGLKLTFTLGDAPANMVIAAVYEGSLALSVGGSDLDPVNESKVTIKSQENGKAEITLAGFSAGQMALQDIVITNVEVSTESDGSYTLAGTIDATSGTTKVTGSMGGTIKEGKGSLTFTMKPGAMPMDIIAVFTSKEEK